MSFTATRRGFSAGLAAAGASLAASPALAEARRSGKYDTIVRGGEVFDGLGGTPRAADVGIADGKIAAIGNLKSARAALEIDATSPRPSETRADRFTTIGSARPVPPLLWTASALCCKPIC